MNTIQPNHITFKTIILLLLNLFIVRINAQQAPGCPTSLIYSQQNNSILSYPQPNGPATLMLNNMPPGAVGLAVGPAFGFPAPNPTWWTISGGTYWYYNNLGNWTNTGHNTGNGAAVNIGGGGGALYNIVGANGAIYKYTGTGNGFFLANITPAFAGGGPYDIVADMADNFYVLKTNAPGQGLYAYNPQGVLTCSWTGVGMINQSAGCGFSILNTANPSIHRVYYDANGTDYMGNIIPGNSTINFTASPLPQASCDYASCALSVPYGSVTPGAGGGTITCTNPQVTLIASIYGNQSLNWLPAYPSPTSAAQSPTCGGVNWTGPGPNTTSGIVSGQGTPTIVVNQPGVYSFTWTGCNGCPGYSVTASYTVVGQGAALTPTITAPTCISSPTQISVSPNTTTNTIAWAGPGIVGPNNTPTININAAGIYTVSISVPNSACAGTATVQINQTPTVNIAASSLSICALNTNGSNNSVTLTASGAVNYTWSAIGLINTSTSNTNSSITFTPDANISIGTVTLVGSNGTCSNSATASITIIQNPTISVTSGSVCSGNNFTLVASGAANYTWSPSSSLNTANSATVISSTNTTSIYSVIGSSLGCNSATQASTLIVNPNPTITVTPLTNTICQGGNLILTAVGANNYTWSPSSSLSSAFGPNVSASPLSTTSYTVVGELNTCTASAVYQVSVIPVPNIQVSASAYTICSNSSAIITANGASNYSWTPATGLNTSSGNQVTASPATTTTYVVTGKNGQCTAYGSVTISVVPVPVMSLNTPNPKLCKGTSTQIFANGASNFTWTPSTGLNNTNASVVLATPESSTNYTVTGFNAMGNVVCAMTQEILIEVVPQVTAATSNSAAICAGQSVKIFAYGGNKYEWQPPAGLDNNEVFNPFASPKSTTIYTVTISNDGNCSGTSTLLVKVNPIPEINAGPDFIANIDDVINLNATGSGTMTWVSGDGIICKSCPNTQILPKKSGCYLIETVNEYGCKNRDEVCAEITSNYNIYIPNIFTPNGDGNNDEFLVYGTGLTKFEMMVFDRWGEKLFVSKDQQIGWDGTYKGVLSKNDVYTYQVKYQAVDGKTYTRTGHVTLMK